MWRAEAGTLKRLKSLQMRRDLGTLTAMTVLHHLTAVPPRLAGTDAVFQDVAALLQHFDGAIANRYPLRIPTRIWPKQFYGLHDLRHVRQMEAEATVNHIWFAMLYPFAFLRFLAKPVIYSVTAGLQNYPPPARFMHSLRMIIIDNERDRGQLDAWGLRNYRMIRPGIDLTRFAEAPVPTGREFVLLAASAPWTRGQIRSKGWRSLLDVASRMPDLRLVLLLRGWLGAEIKRMVSKQGLTARVEIIDGKVDVGRLMARTHAAVVLAENSKLVKAWPHSLLEAMAVGRPVVVSQAIPMSDYVAQSQCGVVAADCSADTVFGAIERLRNDYDCLQVNAATCARRDFDRAAWVQAWRDVYSCQRV